MEKLNQRLTQAAYSTSHYGKSLFWYTTELLFGFYLAEVYRIPSATLGILLLVFLLWDATTDPLIGMIFGRRQASTRDLIGYQLCGAILSSGAFMLVFFKPALDVTGLTAYALVVGILFRTAYTLFDVPQNTLLRRLANSDDERLILSSIRTALSALATLTVAFAATLVLSDADLAQQAQGFTATALTFVVVAVATSVILYLLARDIVDAERGESAPGSFRSAFIDTIRKRDLRSLFIAIFFLSIGWPLFGKLLPFFTAYALNDVRITGSLLSTIAIATLLSQPAVITLVRFPRRQALLGITALVLASGVYFVLTSTNSMAHAAVGTALLASTTSAMGVLVWTMLADSLQNTSAPGSNDLIAFGIFTFSSKIGLGLGGWLLGWILGLIGYTSGEPMPEASQLWLVCAMAFAPAAAAIGATLCIVMNGQSARKKP